MLKKKIGALLAGAMILSLWGSATFASVINVGGVHWDPDHPLDLTIQAQNLRETSVNNVGDVLTGYGQVTAINGSNSGVGLCPGCNLTFVFNYTVSHINSNGGVSKIVFNKGSIDFFVDSTSSFDILDPTTAGVGTPWLSLQGHEAPRLGYSADGELYSTVTGNVGNPPDGSSGFGLLDVVGGEASYLFDTNTQTDGADFFLNSSYQWKPADICADGLCYPIGGQAGLSGMTVSVPTPGTIGLMGFGLLLLGFEVRRRRKDA